MVQDLPITTEVLYQRLKKRGVLMVPGHYFFPGLEHDWPHTHQCMRMNYVPDRRKSSAAWRSRRKRSNARIRKANAN